MGEAGGCSLVLHWKQRIGKEGLSYIPGRNEVPGVEGRELEIPRH